ncbi:MAG TPA: hypothetical protein VMU69_06520 [Bradyrhizobium sp.]|nr:hypothetical protein [Bradyrhizobium sp.]
MDTPWVDDWLLILYGPVLRKCSQRAHHVVVVRCGWVKATNDPIEQVGIGTLKQSFEAVELLAVEIREMDLDEAAKNKVALLCPPMPAPEEKPLAAHIDLRSRWFTGWIIESVHSNLRAF